jgi:hypothetical protein
VPGREVVERPHLLVAAPLVDRPHLLLFERSWDEPRRCCTLRWHVVDAATGAVSRYALTSEAWTAEELQALLARCGFARCEVLQGLPGTPAEEGLFAVAGWSG